MFRQLDYQDRVITTLDAYLDLLKEKKARADRIAALAAQDPDLGLPVPDFAKEAWDALKADGQVAWHRARRSRFRPVLTAAIAPCRTSC